MSKKHRQVAPILATNIAMQTRDVVNVPGAHITSSLTIPAAAYPLTVVEAAGISAVRRCVSLIANVISASPWVEWDGSTQVEPVSRIVRRPAAMMTRREWTWRVIAQMALQDTAYLLMTGGIDDEGSPGSLIPLPREAISPAGFIDPFGIFPPTSYTIAGKPGTVSAENVIVLRSSFWPGVPPHLVGVLQMARNALMSVHASDIYASRYWQAGGAPTTVLSTEQELTDPQAANLADRWRDRRSKGPDYPAVLGKGAHAEPWGVDVNNAVAVEARREMTVEVANLFGVPVRYLNVNPAGTSMAYANINDEALSLERFTLSGFIAPIEDAISDLLPDPRLMNIDMTKLTRAGQEARYRAWQIATGSKPWMMPSEVREFEHMPESEEISTLDTAQVEGAQAAAVSFANRAAGNSQPDAQAPAAKEVANAAP